MAVRGKDGVVRAFQNVCRHRGMRIVADRDVRMPSCVRITAGLMSWTDRLRHIPHAEGFPGLDKQQHGLAPLRCGRAPRPRLRLAGIDAQLDTISRASRDHRPVDQKLYATSARDTRSELEDRARRLPRGLSHPCHASGHLLPYGFDNLNVIEHIGPHSRVTFPFRRIEKLAAVPPDERRVMGFVTFVYHIFPNALVTVLSNHTNLLVLEPLGVDRTHVVAYSVTNRAGDAAEVLEAVDARRATSPRSAPNEDRAIVSAIQRGVASDANESFRLRPLRERDRPFPSDPDCCAGLRFATLAR